MNAYVTTYTHRCVVCGELTVVFHEHTTGKPHYWVCDNCGAEIRHVFTDEGRAVTSTPTGRRCERTLLLLKVREFPRLMFITRSVRWDDQENSVYSVETHNCPTNLIGGLEVFLDGEGDPHGMFELVEEVMITGPQAEEYESAMQQLSERAKALTFVASSPRED